MSPPLKEKDGKINTEILRCVVQQEGKTNNKCSCLFYGTKEDLYKIIENLAKEVLMYRDSVNWQPREKDVAS